MFESKSKLVQTIFRIMAEIDKDGPGQPGHNVLDAVVRCALSVSATATFLISETHIPTPGKDTKIERRSVCS